MSIIKKLTDKEIDERVALAMMPPQPVMPETNPDDLLRQLVGLDNTQGMMSSQPMIPEEPVFNG